MKYTQLVKAIDSTSQHLLGRAVTAVNQALVIRNWLIGAYIVEFEQRGEDRARYGERLYLRLAADLREKQTKGCGERMLQQMAAFYRAYPQIGRAIPQPVVAELRAPLAPKQTGDSVTTGCGIGQPLVGESSGVTPLSPKTVLQFSWSQILELIRIEDPLKEKAEG